MSIRLSHVKVKYKLQITKLKKKKFFCISVSDSNTINILHRLKERSQEERCGLEMDSLSDLVHRKNSLAIFACRQLFPYELSLRLSCISYLTGADAWDLVQWTAQSQPLGREHAGPWERHSRTTESLTTTHNNHHH